jgi:hypothetical protein
LRATLPTKKNNFRNSTTEVETFNKKCRSSKEMTGIFHFDQWEPFYDHGHGLHIVLHEPFLVGGLSGRKRHLIKDKTITIAKTRKDRHLRKSQDNTRQHNRHKTRQSQDKTRQDNYKRRPSKDKHNTTQDKTKQRKTRQDNHKT